MNRFVSLPIILIKKSIPQHSWLTCLARIEAPLYVWFQNAGVFLSDLYLHIIVNYSTVLLLDFHLFFLRFSRIPAVRQF